MNEIEEKKQALIDILNDICSYALCTKLTRCKSCRFFLPVTFDEAFADTDPKSVFVQTTKVCIKGHNGYETFGCTEGESRNVQD